MASYRREMESLDDQHQDVIPEKDVERYGGPQGGDDDDDEQQKQKQEERERKKKEVRDRLAAERQGKSSKKGFLTPQRKKKLRKMLNAKAAEALKAQQLQKEQERKKALAERTIKCPDLDSMGDQNALAELAKKFYDRVMVLEAEKFDIAYQVSNKDMEINELTIAVCELKGKYVKPPLKKVSKYDNKFKKMLQKQDHKEADYAGFRQNLKKSEKKDVFEELQAKKEAKENPEWARKKREEAEAEAAAAPKTPRPPKPEKPVEEAPPAEAPAADEIPAEEAAPAEVVA